MQKPLCAGSEAIGYSCGATEYSCEGRRCLTKQTLNP